MEKWTDKVERLSSKLRDTIKNSFAKNTMLLKNKEAIKRIKEEKGKKDFQLEMEANSYLDI